MTSRVVNLTGEKVVLGPSTGEAIEAIHRWENDAEVCYFSGDPLRPRSLESIQAEYEQRTRGDARDSVVFLIYERATDRLIGQADLRHIDGLQRTAEFGIMLGEKDCWGKGYGTEATRLMLTYAFSVVGLHNVLLDTYSYNERAIRAYLRAGFREIGRRRQAKQAGQHIYDVVYMDCLAPEFTAPDVPELRNILA